MKITREIAQTAAEWWGEQVQSGGRHDNGDPGMISRLAGILADQLNKPVSDEVRESFVQILTDKIMAFTEKHKIFPIGYLSSDYAPSYFLQEAAKEAGISSDNFPWKTCMQIFEDVGTGSIKIMVRPGYGASWVQIWPKKKEQKEKVHE